MEIWSKVDKNAIISYVNDRRMSDGGFVFYRMEPSGGLDTFYALSILNDLNIEIQNKEEIIAFIDSFGESNGLVDVYIKVMVYRLLGKDTNSLKDEVSATVESYLIKELLDNKIELMVETVSIFESPNKVVELCQLLDIPYDEEMITKKVLSYQKEDGGFGKECSNLADTYYAIKLLNLLKIEIDKYPKVINYIKNSRWYKSFHTRYLEDIFYLIQSLKILNQPVPHPKSFIVFIANCQKNGGFARNYPQAIANLEYTYLAVKSLLALEEV